MDAEIIRKSEAQFTMSSAIERIKGHGITINSIIDIGASNGKWSVKAMSVFPNAKVLAVEPLAERAADLARLNKAHKNFDYVNCVAGNEDGGEVSFSVTEDLDGSTVNGNCGSPRTVPMRTIDAVLSEKKMVGPYLLKFDTHGFEIPILQGCRDALMNTNIVVMEVYNFEITTDAKRYPEMCTHMEGLGFRCYDLAAPMRRHYDKSFWQMDLFFCRSDSKIFSYPYYK